MPELYFLDFLNLISQGLKFPQNSHVLFNPSLRHPEVDGACEPTAEALHASEQWAEVAYFVSLARFWFWGEIFFPLDWFWCTRTGWVDRVRDGWMDGWMDRSTYGQRGW